MRSRRDAVVVTALVLAAALLLVTARVDAKSRQLDPTTIPSGWHEVERRLNDVLIPTQVFAAATYPIVLHHRPGRCGPPPVVLAEMPPGGVLLQVFEYPPVDLDGDPLRVPRLPHRPRHFSYSDATWAAFECAGPSYRFEYSQAGLALQAHVWMHRATVDPRLRAGALRILDGLRLPRLAGQSEKPHVYRKFRPLVDTF